MNAVARADLLRAVPPELGPWLDVMVQSAESQGVPLYLVGGAVRDLHLGLPLRDLDLCFGPAPGITARDLLGDVLEPSAKIQEFPRFQTLRVDVGGQIIDLGMARSEVYPSPGALPTIEPATIEEDLRRRDFGAGAMALPLVGPDVSMDEERGVMCPLVDPCGGEQDLEARTLRALHERSFHDDPTRALRAARLGARLGFSLSRGSRGYLRDAMRDGAFGRVSGERLRRELEAIFAESALTGASPAEPLRRLSDWHVWTVIEPGLTLPKKAVAPLRRLGRALHKPPWRGPRVRPFVPGLALWLAELSPGLRRRALRRFSYRSEVAAQIADFPKLRDSRLAALARERGRGAVDARLGDISEDQLFALFAAAPPTTRRRIERWAAEDRSRRLPVTGADLVAEGLSGPDVGKALARVRAAFLDGEIINREEAVALARELGRRRQGIRGGRRKAGSRKGAARKEPPAPTKS